MDFSESPKRFDRIVAIMTQLQSKRIVKAQELADRFEVSLRTIYRDIRSLEASGIPIYGETGIGYSLVDGYKLPPVMFSREEAMSFVAAEKLMEKFTDENMKSHFQSAVFKVKSVLRTDEKDWVNSLEKRVKVNSNQFSAHSPEILNALFESIARKTQLKIKYENVESDLPSERILEPVGLYHENQFWYILAYCHLRKDYRNFRVSRILSYEKLQSSYEIEHRELEFYLKKEETTSKGKIRLVIDRKIARYLENDRNYYGFVSEKRIGEKVELEFQGDFRESGIARWILMFGDSVEILEPIELKEFTLELLDKIKRNLK